MAEPAAVPSAPSTVWSDLRHVALGNGLTVAALAILALIVVLGLIGPEIAPWDPLASSASLTLKPPSLSHPFGTDALGRDILSRVIVAARLDLLMAFGAVVLSFALGTALGAIAGYVGGAVDQIVGRVMDTIMAFPLFVLAMGIVAALGRSTSASPAPRSTSGATRRTSRRRAWAATARPASSSSISCPTSCRR